MRPALCALIAALAPSFACAVSNTSGPAAPLVRVRASSELDCPQEDIRLEQELSGLYKAVGCGRKAHYRAACEGLVCEVRAADEPSIPWRDRPEPAQSPGGR